MKLYGIIIGITELLLFLINLENFSVRTFLVILIQPVCLTALDGLAAFFVRHLLPSKWFSCKKGFSQVFEKEIHLYELLKIRLWKDSIPELGMFTGFRKNKITCPKSRDYLERFILESRYGVYCHLLGVIFGFLPIFIFPPEYRVRVCIPSSFVNAVLSGLPVMVLRFNLHRLYRVLEKQSRISESFNHHSD